MTSKIPPTVIHADCREAMRAMEPNSVHAIVTDPPYGLDFMGEKWDHGVPGVDFWQESLRVTKPGAFLLACGGTRTFHRLASAIEDGGWEVRDAISWLYSSGFPKSRNLHGEWEGWGTALKPSWEPIIVARKPLEGNVEQNVAKHGTGVINIDSARLDMGAEYNPNAIQRQKASGEGKVGGGFGAGRLVGKEIPTFNAKGRWPANVAVDEEAARLIDEQTGVGKFGGGSRFFFTPKASRRERGDANSHPTVKPLALMRYCVKLVTPPGGTVLDPFSGSGTTLLAAMEEGFASVGIEREADYVEIIRARISQHTKD